MYKKNKRKYIHELAVRVLNRNPIATILQWTDCNVARAFHYVVECLLTVLLTGKRLNA